jgi:hypothetical protein
MDVVINCCVGFYRLKYQGLRVRDSVHVNPIVRRFGQREARQRNYKRLKLGGGQAYDRSAD